VLSARGRRQNQKAPDKLRRIRGSHVLRDDPGAACARNFSFPPRYIYFLSSVRMCVVRGMLHCAAAGNPIYGADEAIVGRIKRVQANTPTAGAR
jgi:hypothetical protein